jgi:acetate kinase
VVDRASHDPDAGLALDVYLHRLAGGIASMTAALGGLDALVFTGGVGEHSAAIRDGAASRLSWLGVEMDAVRNRRTEGDAVLTAAGADVDCLVVTAREDLQIAAETRALLSAHDGP